MPHDANTAAFWSAWAAAASAVAAIASTATGLFGYELARRSTAAAETAQRLSTRAGLHVKATRPEEADGVMGIVVSNAGPGVCVEALIWPSTHSGPYRQFTYKSIDRLPDSRVTWLRGEGIMPGTWVGGKLPVDLREGDSADFIIDWEDSFGNHEQSLFSAFWNEGNDPFFIKRAGALPQDKEPSLRQTAIRWYKASVIRDGWTTD